MAEKTLTELANLYGSDKGTLGPSDQWAAHNYTDIYAAYLEGTRHSPISLLEIGIGVVGDRWNARIVHGRNTGGASLKMWYDYFPKARIFGIDINPCPYLDNDRIKTFVADQSKPGDLEAFAASTNGVEFDVIVDDGRHLPEHQQISLGVLFKRLKSGGLYIIEDLEDNGLGDGRAGKVIREGVKNTRSVLKHFREQGSFLEPNALIDPGYLTEHIACLAFHAPSQFVRVAFTPNLRRPIRTAIRSKPDTEALCAIRKK